MVDHSEALSPQALAETLWSYDQHVTRKGLTQTFGAVEQYLVPDLRTMDNVAYLHFSFLVQCLAKFLSMSLAENMQWRP